MRLSRDIDQHPQRVTLLGCLPPFLPGRPLPDPSTSQERTLYHAPRQSREMATMTREAGLWQWRQLRGDGVDVYGSGGWNELQKWLAQG